MHKEIFSRPAAKKNLGHPEKKINIEQLKRQKAIFGDLRSRPTPKHYPYIFLDQRLRTRFFA